MAVSAGAGTTVEIGTSKPATLLADFTGDSYVKIGEVENAGEFGDEASTVTFTSLGDARVRKSKGPRDAGNLALVVGADPLDVGQQALVAAEATPFNYNFRVTLNDAPLPTYNPTVIYLRALVMSGRRNVGAADTVGRKTFTLAIQQKPLEVPSALKTP